MISYDFEQATKFHLNQIRATEIRQENKINLIVAIIAHTLLLLASILCSVWSILFSGKLLALLSLLLLSYSIYKLNVYIEKIERLEQNQLVNF